MTTVAILPISDANGEKSYRAIAGDKHSVGKTAGQALDALTAQLGETEFRALLVIQSFRPDPFFSAEQQEQLSELMSLWRLARDQGRELPPEQQAELDRLVEAELQAATVRTAALMPQKGFMNPDYTVVAERANHRCEYCQAPEVVFNFPFEVEHIIPIARQGARDEANLALACRSCNLRKGTRISGIASDSNTEVRFFHPRADLWNEHFQIDVASGKVRGMTPIGEVTVECLKMNSSAQIAARQLWIRLGLFL